MHDGNIAGQSTEKVAAAVRNYIVENFLFGDAGDLSDSDSLLDNGALDSTGVLELVAFLEQQCGIRVRDEDLIPENLDTIERVALFVVARAAAAPSA